MKKYTFNLILGILFLLPLSEIKAQKIVKYFIGMRTTHTMTLWDNNVVPIYSFHIGLRADNDIPGPTIYAEEGDSVIILARNISRPHDHTIHLHGLDVDTRNDGDPATSFAIAHGRDCTYSFRATHAGTYIYHCHYMDVSHVQMGMYGSVIIKAAQGKKTAWTNGPAYDKEYSWLCSELDKLWHDSLPKRPDHTITIPLPPYDPKYFLVNGRSQQQLKDTTIEINSEINKTIYLRLANIGYYYNRFVFPKSIQARVIDSDGRPLPKDFITDSLEISPGERYGVLFSSTSEINDSIEVQYINMNNYQIKGIEKVALKITVPNSTENSLASQDNFVVFPNPSNESIQIKLPISNNSKRFKIYHSMGNLIDETELPANTSQFTYYCKNLPEGIYFIELIGNSISEKKKFIKVNE